jgi:hypothetical protein
MRKLAVLTIVAGLIAASGAQAQYYAGPLPGDGNIQNYGAHWRYQHRDWSRPGRPLNPGVCWERNDYMGLWEWKC